MTYVGRPSPPLLLVGAKGLVVVGRARASRRARSRSRYCRAMVRRHLATPRPQPPKGQLDPLQLPHQGGVHCGRSV